LPSESDGQGLKGLKPCVEEGLAARIVDALGDAFSADTKIGWLMRRVIAETVPDRASVFEPVIRISAWAEDGAGVVIDVPLF
jgi:hypothetical protein